MPGFAAFAPMIAGLAPEGLSVCMQRHAPSKGFRPFSTGGPRPLTAEWPGSPLRTLNEHNSDNTDESSNADEYERATAHPDVDVGAVYFVALPATPRPHDGQFIVLDAYDGEEGVFEGVTESDEVITIPPNILEAWLEDDIFQPIENPDDLAAVIGEVRA